MKYVGVSLAIYDLIMALEIQREKLDFAVFYDFREILQSSHFCPAFYVDDVYFEIQYDDDNNLSVIDFGTKGWKEQGDELTEAYIKSITDKINKL